MSSSAFVVSVCFQRTEFLHLSNEILVKEELTDMGCECREVRTEESSVRSHNSVIGVVGQNVNMDGSSCAK